MLQINALINFLRQHLVDLYQLLRRLVNFDFQLIGSLQRMSHLANLHMRRKLLH